MMVSENLRAFPELVIVGNYGTRESVESGLIRRLEQLEGEYGQLKIVSLWNTRRNNQIRSFLKDFQRFIHQKENNQIPYEQCFKEVFKMNTGAFSTFNIHRVDDLQKVEPKIKELFIFLQILDERHIQKERYIEAVSKL